MCVQFKEYTFFRFCELRNHRLTLTDQHRNAYYIAYNRKYVNLPEALIAVDSHFLSYQLFEGIAV